ncbi:hypothetical protein Tco_0592995 [Tanacetum coccineum]
MHNMRNNLLQLVPRTPMLETIYTGMNHMLERNSTSRHQQDAYAIYQQHTNNMTRGSASLMSTICWNLKKSLFTQRCGFPYHVVKVLMLSIITETDMQAIYQEMEKQEASDKAFEEQPQSHEVFRKEWNTFSANDKFKSCTKSRSAAMRGVFQATKLNEEEDVDTKI